MFITIQGSLKLIKHEEGEESRSSSPNESDIEDSPSKDSSSNSKEKIKTPIQKKDRLSSRTLPNKFSFRERTYKRKRFLNIFYQYFDLKLNLNVTIHNYTD